jgi:hypothetical protein
MIEFLVVFTVTFLVIAGVTVALVFGRKPVYQPDEEHIQTQLTRLIEAQLPEHEWDFFVNMPIYTDEALEKIRLRCLEIEENDRLRSRQGIVRVNEQGLIKARFLLNSIEQSGKKSF